MVPLEMKAQHLAATRLATDLSAQRLLEGLSRLYRWIVVMDAERHVLWRSEGLADLAGDDQFEIGSDLHRYLPRLPRPEQVFPLRSSLHSKDLAKAFKIEVARKDGSVSTVELHLLEIEAADGEPLLVGIARPEDAVAAPPGRDLAHVLVEHNPGAVLALDSDGFVVDANPAAGRLLGRPVDDLVGSAVGLLFGPDASDVEQLANSLEDRDAGTCTLRVMGEGGDVRTIHVEARNLEPDISGCALYLREQTASEATQAELLRANEELEHCVNALAHDLRSPLVALLGFSRLLRQDYDVLLDQTGKHFLDRIEQAGRTMESLIHDLLELSRIEGPGELSQLVDPQTVLRQLKAELKPRLEEENIELLLPEPPPSRVACDRTRLYQVFSNLLGNAIEHMGNEGQDRRIRVEVREHEDRHELVVSDNGCGISAEYHELIFEVFRSLSGRRRGRQGAGIGLAIVRKIAETHGGRAWVESEAGHGSAFHVTLPRPQDS
jgi:signal transduction histidine kinase